MDFLLSMKRRGIKVEALDRRPMIPIGYDSLLNHYRRLSKSRGNGISGPNPIDMTAILGYNQRIARLGDEFFLDAMQVIDGIVLKKRKTRKVV